MATAGHVDHGKSALILRLTSMDPDRLAEEKRRGLTIDLGFAWMILPSGREIGFVDVPGHERFIRNMLAGVGPVRLVLFVVAADEGWKPQSEEHLQIVDVLGMEGAVVALTKSDLVEGPALAAAVDDVAAHLAGTRAEGAPIIPCSSMTGDGLDELRSAIDAMVETAPSPERAGRPRQFLDRAFTIKGSGTVVTGTLIGGPLAVGQEAHILPSAHRARIRGLQSHRRSLQVARPVSRVAVNLAGTAKEELDRGDVLTLAGQWRTTATFDAALRPVRSLQHPLTGRGAYKVYAGSAERDARIRFLGGRELPPGGTTGFARISVTRPIVVDFADRIVLREAGRRETVAGGVVLDPHPLSRPGPHHVHFLEERHRASRDDLPRLAVEERGAIRASDVPLLTGSRPEEAVRLGAVSVGGWLVAPRVVDEAQRALLDTLRTYHAEHPLRMGLEIGEARSAVANVRDPVDPGRTPLVDPGVADALLAYLEQQGHLVRDGSSVRLSGHLVTTAGREDADRLVRTVAAAEPSPPSVRELVSSGFGLELIRATCAEGRLVRISPDLVITPEFFRRAEAVVRESARPSGITVSAFREALGTSRKFALPILEYFDAHGITHRRGDIRVLRG